MSSTGKLGARAGQPRRAGRDSLASGALSIDGLAGLTSQSGPARALLVCGAMDVDHVVGAKRSPARRSKARWARAPLMMLVLIVASAISATLGCAPGDAARA